MNRLGLSSPDGAPQAGLPVRAAAASSLPDFPDRWLEIVAAGLVTSPLAGEPGHGWTAVLRRQPVLTGDGRAGRRYTGAFELICCECGDNRYLDYSQVSSRLRQLRGPYTMSAGLAAYERHLGLAAANPPA
jgi:hypothetical protein